MPKLTHYLISSMCVLVCCFCRGIHIINNIQATALNRFVEDDSADGQNTDFNADFDADFDLPPIGSTTAATAAPALLLRLNSNGSQVLPPPHVIDDVSTANMFVMYHYKQ
jgi:hypothetical protein